MGRKEEKKICEKRSKWCLYRLPVPPNIAQIRKLIVSSEVWDGDIWGEPNDRKPEDNPGSPQNLLNMKLELLLK